MRIRPDNTDCKNCYPNLVPMDVVDDGGNEIHIQFIWETWSQVLQSVLAVFSYTGIYICHMFLQGYILCGGPDGRGEGEWKWQSAGRGVEPTAKMFIVYKQKDAILTSKAF